MFKITLGALPLKVAKDITTFACINMRTPNNSEIAPSDDFA